MKIYAVEEIDDEIYPHPTTVIGYFSTIKKRMKQLENMLIYKKNVIMLDMMQKKLINMA